MLSFPLAGIANMDLVWTYVQPDYNRFIESRKVSRIYLKFWCQRLIPGKKDDDGAADIIDIPKRTTPAKGTLTDPHCIYYTAWKNFHISPIKTILIFVTPFFLGYELLFQPEVVRIYTSLLKESKNPTVLEASAGAVQNLCAGRWTVRTTTVLLLWELIWGRGI